MSDTILFTEVYHIFLPIVANEKYAYRYYYFTSSGYLTIFSVDILGLHTISILWKIAKNCSSLYTDYRLFTKIVVLL